MSDSFIPIQAVTPDQKLDTEQLTIGANVVERERIQIPDGSDLNAGAIADAAVTTDVNATLSAKLRGLVKIIGNVWDSGNTLLRVGIQNATLAVTQSGVWDTRNITGTVSLPTGAATDASLTVIDTDIKATQPRDVTDRVGRLLGHVTV